MRYSVFFLLVLSSSLAWAQAYLQYSEACSKEDNIQITAVGDVLLHSPLQIQASKNQDRFLSLWPRMIPIFQNADIAYANLEGPVAPGVLATGNEAKDPGFLFDNRVYGSYPQFNYHSYLIQDLVKSSIDILSTANNHSLDRRSLGVDRTIEELEKEGVAFTGTRSTREMNRPWHAITQVKGRTVAWLACTFSTNGITDKFKQVLSCYENTNELLNMVRDLSRQPGIDAVIVTPHWGVEYNLKPHESQVWLGRKFIEAGATAVIGTHPHVIQPWEKYKSSNGREGFIIYSTGNFVSGQDHLPRRTSVMVQLNLTGEKGQKLKIRGVQFLPLFMQKGSGGYQVSPIFNFETGVPAAAVSLWKQMYNEKQRILSVNEETVQKICEASSKD
ncbi:MAG: CapA family protein [Pseudobdellovibrionaceae bacterium]